MLTTRSVIVLAGTLLLAGCTTKIAIGEDSREYLISPWRYWNEFNEREALYKQWAQEAVDGEATTEHRIIKVLEWTKRKVAPQPERCLVIDDHIANVVKRGYGAGYQQAEVFTTLTTALGLESRWAHAQTPTGGIHGVQLAFVEAERGWVVLDVTNGGWFESGDGHIATILELERSDTLKPRGPVADFLPGDTVRYQTYFRNLYTVEAGNQTRAHGQFFWDRVRLIFHVAPERWTQPIEAVRRS